MQAQRLDRWDVLWGGLIFGIVLATLLASTDIGFTRDESFYFHAGRDYIGWFEGLWDNIQQGRWRLSFTQAEVDRHWTYNHEHPVLIKSLFALSNALFHGALGWMESSTAMRLPTMLLSSWLVVMVYGMGRQMGGRVAGVAAALALIAQPRFFFHAHMACFDAAIGALWFATMYAYWRSWESARWALVTGLLWGLALATKLNAFFIPIVLLLHWLFATWRQWGVGRDARGAWGVCLPQFPYALVAMAVLGPLIFYVHWPYIWFNTFERVRWYMNFHLKHEHYFVNYFGQNLYAPPFPIEFPFVMTLVTVPATILVASALGMGWWWAERGGAERARAWGAAVRARALPPAGADTRATGVFLVLNLMIPIAIIAQPSTPIFGGTKHWIPAMPYLAIFAGIGVARSAEAFAHMWRERTSPARQRLVMVAASATALAALTLPALWELKRNHPHGTAYYNELIGSYQGAADRGMMRQFWGYASRQSLPWVNEHAQQGARVFTHNTTSWAWHEYNREQLTRSDLRDGYMGGSDMALYHQQKAFHFIRHELWREYEVRVPSYVVELDGVPLLSVYERPAARARRLKGDESVASPPKAP